MIKVSYIDTSSIKCLLEIKNLIKYTTEEKKRRLRKLRSLNDQINLIFGESLVRYIISTAYSIDINDIEFKTNKYGKPFLTGLNSIFFNISHSKNFVVCALSDRPIGIDIEYISKIEWLIVNSEFCSSEKKYLLSLDEDLKNDAFYTLWCLKECYLKNIGTGLFTPLDSIGFSIQNNNIHVCSSNINTSYLKFKILPIIPDYKVAMCFEPDIIKISEIFPQQIIQFFNEN